MNRIVRGIATVWGAHKQTWMREHKWKLKEQKEKQYLVATLESLQSARDERFASGLGSTGARVTPR